MKALFRPKGLIAFALATLLIILFWWLLADWLLKRGIEQGAGALLETQVELESAQLQLSPFGFKLTGLQVTNPKDPMQNIVSATTISGYLQPLPLLMGQIIISKLEADALQLYSPRRTLGIIPKATTDEELPEKPTTTDETAASEPFVTSLPSVDELLDRLPIKTIKLAKAFDNNAQQTFNTLEQQISELPNSATFNEYELRFKEATEGEIKSPQDFQQRVADLKQLKAELKEEKQAITEVRDHIKQSQQQLSIQWSELKEAPEEDLKILKESYGFSGDNLSNISGLLFGEQAQKWTAIATPYLKHAQRLISESEEVPAPPRGEGRFVHFATDRARPDFLIQQAALSINLPIGKVTLTADNITHQPEILGSAMTVNITGHNLKQIAHINIDALFDYRMKNSGFTKITGIIQQWKLHEITLSKNDNQPIAIAAMTQDIEGELLMKNNQLQGSINSRYSQVNWVQPEKPTTLQQLLSNIEDFDMQLALQGAVSKPEIKLRSNLDERLNSAFNQQLKQEQKTLEKKLSTHLNQQIEQRAGGYREQLNELKQQQGSLQQQISQLELMLSAKVENRIEDEKSKLKEQLKDKLLDKFKF